MPRISPRLLDWAIAVSGALILVGLSLILRAGSEGKLTSSLVSVWHIPLYLGILFAAYAILAAADPAPGLGWRDRLPGGYLLSGLGLVLFVVGFVTDLGWTAVAGDELEVVALVTPTHLLAFAGIAMVLLGPILSSRGSTGGRLRAAPAIVSLGLLLALGGGVTSFANPFAQVLAGAPAMDPILANPAELWSMRADGSAQTRLSDAGSEIAATPSWSRDGAQTSHSFWRYVPGKDPTTPEGVTSSLVIQDSAGSQVATVNGDGWLAGAVWSPSGGLAVNLFHPAAANPSPVEGGSTAANPGAAEPQANAPPAPGYVAPSEGMQWDIAIVRADDGEVPQLVGSTPATDIVTDWSLDGSSLLMHSDRSGNFEIYAMDPATGGAVNLTHSAALDDWAAWSPDGTEIAFTSDRSEGSHIWLMDADGSHPHRLTSGTWADWLPAWSPSGKLTFLSNRDGQAEIYAMEVDGSHQLNLTRTPSRDEFMTAQAWSPDGDAIWFEAAPTPAPGNNLTTPLAAAGIIIQSIILVGILSLAASQRLLVPGAVTVAFLIGFTAFSFVSDRYVFIVAALVAGVLADVALWLFRPLAVRTGRRLFFLAVPILVYAGYFAALAVTGDLGWPLATVIAFTGLAGATGLATTFLSEAVASPRA